VADAGGAEATGTQPPGTADLNEIKLWFYFHFF